MYQQWLPLKNSIYESQTDLLLNSEKTNKKKQIEAVFANRYGVRVLRFLKRFSKKVKRKYEKYYPTTLLTALQQIDIVAPVVPTEMKYINSLGIQPEYAPFSYNSIGKLIGNIELPKSVGENILVGNSATATNNHLEIFQKLSRINLGKRKIIVPLSYGNDEYRKNILKKGKELLGDNFHPLVDFIPFEEYNSILKSCGIAIFNHIRQQAVFNIIIMMHMGATVYLNRKSPVFEYLKAAQGLVYNFDAFSEKSLNSNNALLDENKVVVERLYGAQAVAEKVTQLINIVKQKV